VGAAALAGKVRIDNRKGRNSMSSVRRDTEETAATARGDAEADPGTPPLPGAGRRTRGLSLGATVVIVKLLVRLIIFGVRVLPLLHGHDDPSGGQCG
jgi:hypothetical protein